MWVKEVEIAVAPEVITVFGAGAGPEKRAGASTRR